MKNKQTFQTYRKLQKKETSPYMQIFAMKCYVRTRSTYQKLVEIKKRKSSEKDKREIKMSVKFEVRETLFGRIALKYFFRAFCFLLL